MTWDDEAWPTTRPLEVGRDLAVAARAIDAPPAPAARLEVGSAARLEVATPCPVIRAVGPGAGDPWLRRLERWREVEAALARAAGDWPAVAPAWGWGEGDARAPVEAGAGSGTWSRVETCEGRPLGVRGAVAATRPRRVVIRGARRAGKSSNVAGTAVADATSGSWAIAAGTVGLGHRLVSLARVDKRAGKVQAPGTRHPPSG